MKEQWRSVTFKTVPALFFSHMKACDMYNVALKRPVSIPLVDSCNGLLLASPSSNATTEAAPFRTNSQRQKWRQLSFSSDVTFLLQQRRIVTIKDIVRVNRILTAPCPLFDNQAHCSWNSTYQANWIACRPIVRSWYSWLWDMISYDDDRCKKEKKMKWTIYDPYVPPEKILLPISH